MLNFNLFFNYSTFEKLFKFKLLNESCCDISSCGHFVYLAHDMKIIDIYEIDEYCTQLDLYAVQSHDNYFYNNSMYFYLIEHQKNYCFFKKIHLTVHTAKINSHSTWDFSN